MQSLACKTSCTDQDLYAGVAMPLALSGARLVVIGDDSAVGHGARGYNGWAAQLGKLLNQQYGHSAEDVNSVGTSRCLPAIQACRLSEAMATLMPLK